MARRSVGGIRNGGRAMMGVQGGRGRGIAGAPPCRRLAITAVRIRFRSPPKRGLREPNCKSVGTRIDGNGEERDMPARITNAVGRKFAQLMREEEQAETERKARRVAVFKEGFQRSKRGNLWRKWDVWLPDGATRTLTMTVFSDRRGGYSYCTAAGNRSKPAELLFTGLAAPVS